MRLAFKAAGFPEAPMIQLGAVRGSARRPSGSIRPMWRPPIVLAAEGWRRGECGWRSPDTDRKEVAATNNIGIQIFKLVIFDRTANIQQIETTLKKLVGNTLRSLRSVGNWLNSMLVKSVRMMPNEQSVHWPMPGERRGRRNGGSLVSSIW